MAGCASNPGIASFIGRDTFTDNTFTDKKSIDFGSIWGPISGRFGVGFGSNWGRFGIDLGSILGRFGIGSGSIWGRFVKIWGKFWQIRRNFVRKGIVRKGGPAYMLHGMVCPDKKHLVWEHFWAQVG